VKCTGVESVLSIYVACPSNESSWFSYFYLKAESEQVAEVLRSLAKFQKTGGV
jgi:hypothetical protein